MKGLKIEKGDVVRINGKPVVIQDLECYSQRIKHSIRLSLSESVYEPFTGIDWQTVFSSKIPRERILIEIKKIIQKDSETVSVNNIELLENDSNKRIMNIRFIATTIYGIIAEEL
ncbi:DUF2634 domain-containing protein [Leptospira sp. 201903070]|uniref:DUF2634 domain-containing protein n=1 Tax=Leptospira ainlahdjerensis TaxID=2810033 RepID=A0ABS2U9C8_9LEPT|nr:DUF2634 domain-containing protein [Leptospira ainlahdjerensis]MBM9576961.1 DUF2634 domain-containing protein [Leptospira ainlahdjerensis]